MPQQHIHMHQAAVILTNSSQMKLGLNRHKLMKQKIHMCLKKTVPLLIRIWQETPRRLHIKTKNTRSNNKVSSKKIQQALKMQQTSNMLRRENQLKKMLPSEFETAIYKLYCNPSFFFKDTHFWNILEAFLD